MDEARVQVIIEAAKMINKNIEYVYGGGHGQCPLNPTGLDCSSYVSLAFNRAGVTEINCGFTTSNYIEDTAHNNPFEEIPESELKPGDIALNNSILSGQDNHMGIYVGKLNNQNLFFHCSTVNGVSGPQTLPGNWTFKVFTRYKNWNEVHTTSSTNSGIGGDISGLLDDPYPSLEFIDKKGDFTCDTFFYKVNEQGNKEEKMSKKIVDGVFTIMQIGGPAILIILTIIDYLTIMFRNFQESFNKINKKTIKRIIIVIILLLLPFILELLFNIFGLYDLSNCGIS